MGFASRTFITHPDTGVRYSIQDASKLSGINAGTLYKRAKKGFMGKKLWAPAFSRSKHSKLPPSGNTAREEALLALIPDPTEWDLM